MTYYVISVVTLLAIFTLLGMSFNLLMGYAGQFSIAHAAFFGVGAYTTAILMRDVGVGFIIAVAMSTVFAGIASLIIGVAARRVTDIYLAVLTLGFQVAFTEVVGNLSITGGTSGLTGIPQLSIFGATLTSPWHTVIAAWALCGIWTMTLRMMSRAPFGHALRSMRDDETAARSLGKNVPQLKRHVFVVTSAAAGSAGSIYAIYVGYISPAEFTLTTSIEVLSLTIIGGLAVFWGPYVGAAIVVVLPPVLSFLDLPATLSGPLNAILFSLLVLLFLRFRPHGILGGRRNSSRVDALEEGDTVKLGAGQKETGAVDRGAFAGSDWTPVEGNGQPPRGHSPASTSESGRAVLACDDLSKSFGGLQAVANVRMEIYSGEITGLVGPNGAGKTTLFNLLSGLLAPDEGSVRYRGEDISAYSMAERAKKGLVRSFQEMRLFEDVTTLENVTIAATPSSEELPLTTSALPWGGVGNLGISDREDRAQALLGYLGLSRQANKLASDLSYAEQKLLMIGRLLATEADCYLLDEPMSGLDDDGRDRVIRLLQDTVRLGATICLVEHSLEAIQRVCSRVVFLSDGRVIAEGPTAEITGDRELAEMYFGV